MSRKSIITIAVGILILVVSWVAFNAIFNATAPSEAEINAVATGGAGTVQGLIDKSQQAQGVRTVFYFVAGLEVIITGVLAYQWRED
jgi:hypothetical protein